ncbi:Uncharacterised protein [Vibrio cholerae]|uniref:Uncharacterized protein n=1 Tax=Vibrio cholerae TaxID=666 RepID=A0A655Y870_VIBCL|nr:Uncharacterised protein [Vibrio cholerae]CSB92681.1 Uncharacterised protein [Vibrio cholerae]CSC29976.1 Uncharacterised protein [Vibrio cholerae]CSC31307.1 Uncharacterised protein [Vibrio cholerae]
MLSTRDQRFLYAWQTSITNFHAQITPRHHDHIRRANNAVHRFFTGYHFCALNFGDNVRMAACLSGELARVFNIFRIAWERDG